MMGKSECPDFLADLNAVHRSSLFSTKLESMHTYIDTVVEPLDTWPLKRIFLEHLKQTVRTDP